MTSPEEFSILRVTSKMIGEKKNNVTWKRCKLLAKTFFQSKSKQDIAQ